MFGTIGRVNVKPGSEDALRALDEEWMRTLRPKIPGKVVYVRASVDNHPERSVTIFLCQDAQTYWKLADDPEQDAFFRRVAEHFDGEPEWEDIAAEVVIDD